MFVRSGAFRRRTGIVRRRLSSVLWMLLGTALLFTEVGAVSAQPAKKPDSARLALLIANTTYGAAADPLPQLGRDAAALAALLREDGFETEVKTNLSKLALQSALSAFRAKVKPGATVLLYLGGYGIQAGRRNNFIPVDAQIWVESEVLRDGISIESILSELSAAGARIKLAVLDLSRRNPFERNFRRYSAGLGSLGTPLNTLVISAANQDQVINDTSGENGIFMRDLLKEMRIPDLTAEAVFNKTRLAVSIDTRNEQVPWVASSLTEEFYFRSDGKGEQGSEAAPHPPEQRKELLQNVVSKDESPKVPPAQKFDPKDGNKGEQSAALTPPASCADEVSVKEAAGVADLQITNPCRKGTTLNVKAGQIALPLTFDQAGTAQARVPLFDEVTELSWKAGDGTNKTQAVRYSGFREAFRIALIWRKPVDLQMHIVEPGSTVNASQGHISRALPNNDLGAGLGRLMLDAGSQKGGERIEVYDLPANRNPRSGLFKVYVDFAARGNQAAAPYCGESELAEPSFEIWVLRYGQLEKPRRFGFRAAECGAPIKGRRPNYFADVNAAP